MPDPKLYLTDFSDRMSPMLVKELRQGLRAKTFIGVFLALQVFLGVMLLSAGSSATSDQAGSVISGIIFAFISLALLVVQPLRGTGALASEVKGNTIDMMVLTRLSAWRIVYGKWLAIVSQSALLLTTIIPYLILRYFFGGMNLFGEIVALGLLFLTSMALTAVTVGLSGCSSAIVRSLLPVIGLPALLWSVMVMMMMRAFGGRGSSNLMDVFTLSTTEAKIGVAAYCAALVYMGGSLLSLGASLIAPAAENHALVRRLVALVLTLGLLVLGFFEVMDRELVIMMVFVVTIPAIIIALTDSSPLVSTVCRPFVRWRAPGKVLGWFFYPTWGSGVFYVVLLLMCGLLAMGVGGGVSRMIVDLDEEVVTVILALFGSLLFPAVWQVFLFRGEGQRLSHYLLLLAGSYLLLGVLSALSSSMNSGEFLWFFVWNPLVFIPMLDEVGSTDFTLMVSAGVVNGVLLAILVVKAVMESAKAMPAVAQAEASVRRPG
jgi:ABC-type transport system involved in multi-copper enzyme maturation permease subunit